MARRAWISLSAAAAVFAFALAAAPPYALSLTQEKLEKIDLERAKGMLRTIRDELKKTYFDSAFRGIDVDARFKQAETKLDGVTSFGQAFAVIAQTLLDFNDSHTFFVPPARGARYNYGFQLQMIGDRCYIVDVIKDSDAAAQGLAAGDLVQTVEGFKPNRADLWKIRYLFYSLNPKPSLRIAVQSPSAPARTLEVKARITQGKRVVDLTGSDGGADIDDLLRGEERAARQRSRYTRLGDVAIWKLADFTFDPQQGDDAMREILKGASSLILDLRDNPGGYVESLERLAGHFFSADTRIAELKGRKPMKPMLAKKRDPVFTGRLVVLIDSESGSAAELFARLMQIEKRGTVIGDRSSGSVMQSRFFNGSMGSERVILYGASITDADVIMTDGKSLERVGVSPDEALLPTAEDLAARRDPVLSRAAATLGIALDPSAAGALFPRDSAIGR